MKISLIAAMSENRVIGKENKLPWHISADLKRFKSLTSGHPIIMGRKTYDSIGRPLPNRTNIVVTRDKDLKIEGVTVVHSLDEAVQFAKIQPGGKEMFIIGGAQIFQEGIKLAHKLYLTIIHKTIEGDVYFPDFPDFKNTVLKEDRIEEDYQYSFIDLEK